jgi:hypothetical protein
MTNQYTDTSRMLKSLHNSFTLKVKHHWSRDTGAGFITEDITDIQPSPNGLRFTFGWGCQVLKTSELNLRETEKQEIKRVVAKIAEQLKEKPVAIAGKRSHLTPFGYEVNKFFAEFQPLFDYLANLVGVET